MVFPGASGEQCQNGENLQSSGKHIHDQNKLAKGTVGGEIAGGAYGFQAGTNVVETGQYGSNVSADGEAVQRYQNVADDNKDHIGGQIGV